jgi:hypothetical protein
MNNHLPQRFILLLFHLHHGLNPGNPDSGYSPHPQSRCADL